MNRYMLGACAKRRFTTIDIEDITHDGITSSVPNAANAMCFSNDGTKFYCANNKTVYQYNLSTAWDLSTMSLGGNIAISQSYNLYSLAVNSTGTRMFLCFSDTYSTYGYDRIYQYSMTDGNVTTLSYNSQYNIYSSAGINWYGGDCHFDEANLNFYITSSDENIYQFKFNSADTMLPISYIGGVSYSGLDNDMVGLAMTENKVIITGSQTKVAYQYSYDGSDITTLTYDNKSFDFSSPQLNNPRYCQFKPDYTKFYVLSNYIIYQYSTNI